MMPHTETCGQPHVYSASLNSDTRGIYFAATGFPTEEARWLSGWLDLLAPFVLARYRGVSVMET
jgi:hypothetical protein